MARQTSGPSPLWLLAVTLLVLASASCAPSYTLVNHSPSEEIRTETFQYRKWVSADQKPDTVLIALHGFCGASIDYENLASYLMKHQPRSAVYAYEVRGQGRDPLKERRGDIDDPKNWAIDLNAFTDLVKKENPGARIVWFGESMGALILSSTFRDAIAAGEQAPCDAIGITSPVVKIRDEFPAWKKEVVRGISKLAPGARVSLDALSGGEAVPMTHDSFHSEQSETNAWHIDKHTLRLLVTLGDMIDDMPACAKTFKVPTLILHGGKDYFTAPGDVEAFVNNIPKDARRTRKFYPEGHHLLMYDEVNEEVFTDVAKWLDGLRKQP